MIKEDITTAVSGKGRPAASDEGVPEGGMVSKQQEPITLSVLPIFWQHINKAEACSLRSLKSYHICVALRRVELDGASGSDLTSSTYTVSDQSEPRRNLGSGRDPTTQSCEGSRSSREAQHPSSRCFSWDF